MQYENAVGGIVGAFEIAHHLLIVEKVGVFKGSKGFFVGDIQVGDILKCGFGLLSVMVCNIMLGYMQDVMPDVFYFPLGGDKGAVIIKIHALECVLYKLSGGKL